MIAGFKRYYRTLTLNKLSRLPRRRARWPLGNMERHALNLDIIIGRFTYRSGFFHLSNPAPWLLGRWRGRGLLGRSRSRGLLERWRGRGLLVLAVLAEQAGLGIAGGGALLRALLALAIPRRLDLGSAPTSACSPPQSAVILATASGFIWGIPVNCLYRIGQLALWAPGPRGRFVRARARGSMRARHARRPARFIPTAPKSATQPTRSPLAQLLLVLVLVLALAPLIVRLAYLAPYFARWEVRRMDVHVSGV